MILLCVAFVLCLGLGHWLVLGYQALLLSLGRGRLATALVLLGASGVFLLYCLSHAPEGELFWSWDHLHRRAVRTGFECHLLLYWLGAAVGVFSLQRLHTRSVSVLLSGVRKSDI